MDCESCPALTATKRALTLTESALAETRNKVELLRGQIARLNRASGVSHAMTRRDFAERAGVQVPTLSQWQARYDDYPKAITGTYPVLYERQSIEQFLQDHPSLGKER